MEHHLHSIFQLGKKSDKYVITVSINRIMIEVEVDSGAERLTVPKFLFYEKLKEVCSLSSSTASLNYYNHSSLIIVGECYANTEFNGHNIKQLLWW